MEIGILDEIIQKLERSNLNQKQTIENLLSNNEISTAERLQLNEIREKNKEIEEALKNKDLNKLQKLMENVNSIIK